MHTHSDNVVAAACATVAVFDVGADVEMALELELRVVGHFECVPVHNRQVVINVIVRMAENVDISRAAFLVDNQMLNAADLIANCAVLHQETVCLCNLEVYLLHS